MYDEPSLPYRCPICMQPVSPCTEDATTGKRTCGCLTYSCPAPIFTQAERYKPKWHKVADGDLPNDYRYVWTNVGAGYYDDGW